jgi:hypothetical protein
MGTTASWLAQGMGFINVDEPNPVHPYESDMVDPEFMKEEIPPNDADITDPPKMVIAESGKHYVFESNLDPHHPEDPQTDPEIIVQ